MTSTSLVFSSMLIMTGALFDAASNKCLSARVDLGNGVLLSCDPVPCEIN